MPEDDPFADQGPLGPPPPPDDRLWRHPSEVAWGPAVAPAPLPARPPRLWGIALTSGLTGAVLALGVAAIVGGIGDRVTQRTVERVPVDDRIVSLAVKERGGVPAVAAAVSPSVVRLDIVTDAGESSASGVVLRDDGTVVTNAHVVDGARSITIVLHDGTGVPGRVVGADRLTDVAVVVAADEFRDAAVWVPAVMGSAADLEVGQTAVAIGSPLALAGAPSVTVGVVSGLGRRVSADGLVLHDLIQTDAPIGEGSSGGALCDGAGVVVGLMTAVGTGDGVGFAVPAEVVSAMADQLLAGGVRHPWLGIEGADLAPTEASVPGLADMGGVRVIEVDRTGPAAAAGLQPDDVVVVLDGERVTSMSDLVVALRAREPGDRVVVEVRRGADVVSVDVVLGERP